MLRKRIQIIFLILVLLGNRSVAANYSDQLQPDSFEGERIGVLFVSHGGFETFGEKQTWEATMQIFSYDPNSPVYQRIIWNREVWPQLTKFGNAPKELGKYKFEYNRIGGVDPYPESKRKITQQLTAIMNDYEIDLGVDFIVDKMTWLSTNPDEFVLPRMLYNPGVKNGSKLTYCGDGDPSWQGCNPSRYNVDGPVERMLKTGANRIIVIDLTTAGARFSKTFDIYTVAKSIVSNHNQEQQTEVVLEWVNDPRDLMLKSYPTEPQGWTRSSGTPEKNPILNYDNFSNPVISDLRLAQFQVGGIEASFNTKVPVKNTGVLMVNHGIRSMDQVFDPKINDTLLLNRNIKQLLLEKYPTMNPDNIVGGWFGDMVTNTEVRVGPPAFSQLERSREMRGENLGFITLHDTNNQMPEGEWRYRYWEALEQLKTNGVNHIVVVFPQIIEDSVLNLVEVPNQIAKEIGFKSWLGFENLDFETYPETGHPFADYWGIWARKMCKVTLNNGQLEPCCFEMGGCPNGQPYPPPRQTPLDERRDDLDPSLVFDVSHFGHLGYDADAGAPSDLEPVQNQYTGTWSMWQVTKDYESLAKFLANKVIEHIQDKSLDRGKT